MIQYFTEMEEYGQSSYLNFNDYIAYLERQKEQKPAEWSMEDNYVINKVLVWAEIINPTSSIFEKVSKEKFIERLKSFRPQPHWKPSDE